MVERKLNSQGYKLATYVELIEDMSPSYPEQNFHLVTTITGDIFVLMELYPGHVPKKALNEDLVSMDIPEFLEEHID